MLYSRRATPRADAHDGVYVLWYCNDRGEVSRVHNLNLGGIFIETPRQRDLGASIELDFLVREGPIHARAKVRHVEPGHGLGLKLTAMNDQHCLHFGALMKRLYSPGGDVKRAEPRHQTGQTAFAKPSPVSS